MISCPRTERGLKRLFHALLTAAVALVATGVFTKTPWLSGIGARALTGAVLVEVIHRP